MKKPGRLLALLLALVMALALTGCGAAKSSSYESTAASGDYGYDYDKAEPAAEAPMAMPAEMAASEESYAGENGGIAAAESEPASGTDLNAEKIIYSAYAEIETVDYEAAVDGVYAMVERLGGFMESTSISGSDYYDAARGYESLRSAQFTIRVPSENFNTMTGSLSELGNVPYCNTNSENVTRQYYDVDSRLKAYKTQETRLLEMLEIAGTVEDMLAIQAQLTEVQYEIDSLTSTLRNYDNQVGFSTVTLNLREVREYTPEPTVTMTYWQRMAKGFSRSLESVGRFFTDLFLWLVSNLPMLVLVFALLFGLFLLVRLYVRRRPQRAERRTARRARLAEKKAQRLAQKAEKKNPAEPKE